MTEIKKTKSQQAKTSRRKGQNGERKYVNKFKELGYTFCKTSRNASKLLDDSKVDLAFIPFNVQVKIGYPKGLNYSNIFTDMEEGLKKNFPPTDQQHKYPSIIIHEKGRSKSEKLVIMKEEDFFELLAKSPLQNT